MCKSIAEGGLRCAHHTRPAYLESLKKFQKDGNASTIESLSVNATKYAATPSGAKAIQQTLIADGTSDALRDVLSDALARGQREYEENKELTADIDNRSRGTSISLWARNLPVSEEADVEYRKTLTHDLDLDDDSFSLAWAVAESEFAKMDESELDFLPARFLVKDSAGQISGTPITPSYLATAQNFEKLAAYARKQKRNRLDHTDPNGTLWIRYENDALSEVLRSVSYQQDSQELTVGLVSHGTNDTVFYSYKDVNPELVDQLCSARSMGRFYAHVFGSSPEGGSFKGRSLEDYAFVKHTSNNLIPTTYSAGKVPKGVHEKVIHSIR